MAGWSNSSPYLDTDKERMRQELRTTKRALWLARAMRAELQWEILEETYPISMREEIVKWRWVERKCLEKAEEFK